MDLKKLMSDVNAFSAERDWDQFHSIKNLVMALSVECSELVEIFQWMSEENSNKISSDTKNISRVEDEVADIFVYLLRIASKANIDVEKAIYQKLQKNALKYPVHLSKGNSKKYDEF